MLCTNSFSYTLQHLHSTVANHHGTCSAENSIPLQVILEITSKITTALLSCLNRPHIVSVWEAMQRWDIASGSYGYTLLHHYSEPLYSLATEVTITYTCYSPIANRRLVCKPFDPFTSRPARISGSVSRPFRLVHGPAVMTARNI